MEVEISNDTDWIKWNWDEICGPGGFTLWSPKHRDLGLCFQELCLQVPVLAILAVLSAYHCGKRSHWISRGHNQQCYLIFTRGLATFLMAIAPILRICLAIAVSPGSMKLVEYFVAIVESLTWMVHLCYILTLKHEHSSSLRGPIRLCIAWTLSYVLVAISVRSHFLLYHFNVSPELALIISLCYGFSVTSLTLQSLYLITLIPSQSFEDQDSNRHTQVSEWDPLLGPSRQSSYNGFREEQDPNYLGVAMEGSTFCSRLLFHWATPLMNKGAELNLVQVDDLYDLPVSSTPAFLCARLNAAMSGQHKDPSPMFEIGSSDIPPVSYQRATLVRALHSCFGIRFYSVGLLKLGADCMGFLGPVLLNRLVTFIENRDQPLQDGYLYAAGLCASTLIAALCNTHFNFLMAEVGLMIRASLITTIYRKTLYLSSTTLSTFSIGEIVNFMSTDTDRIVNSCPSFHAFWSIPFQIAVTLYLLYNQVGLAFLAGVAFTVILIPINKYIASQIGRLSTQLMLRKDERVKVMAEVLQGVRVIKLHVWEEYFLSKIGKLRDLELKYLRGRKYLDALCVYFWATTPVLISILTFTTYVLLGNQLTAATVFTTIALLNMLIAPLNAFPWVLNGLMESWVSVKRIQRLLELEDVDMNSYYTSMPSEQSELAILIKDGTFSWHQNEETPTLSNIDLTVKKGDLIGVMGRVGSGKSSLLAALLAELHKNSGIVGISDLDSGVGLVSQTAWLQRGTLRDNILFGKSYDASRYKLVLEACCLEPDLKVLPGGDQVGVGEGGATLSGGQKARVALARAVYQDKSIYLLDDILSAVDVHVALHITQHCINGILRSKTRILCTHQSHHLLPAHKILVLDEGSVVQQGKPDLVLPDFDECLSMSELEVVGDPAKAAGDGEEAELTSLGGDSVLDEEDREVGSIRLNVYGWYWRAVGHLLGVVILLSMLFMQTSRNLTDWWLSYWVTHGPGSHPGNQTNSSSTLMDAPLSHEDEVNFYLMVYGILAGVNSLFTLLRAFLFAYAGIHAATSVHRLLLRTIIKARVTFFDISPLGRILNRFSTDTYTIDDSLPFILNILLAQFFSVIGTLIVIVYGLPWLVLVLAPLVPVYHYLQQRYRLTSRELKRLSSVTMSPVYSHFSETLQGLPTIRAFRTTSRFKRENEDHVEANVKCQYASQVAAQWLGLRLQLIGVATVTGVGVIAVLQHQYDMANPGLIGLAVSYALSVTGMLGGVVNAFTETEREMIAVERVSQYVHQVEPESQTHVSSPPYGWPSQGVIVFTDVVLKYRDHLSPSLLCVNLETRPAEKVGVVGRTGAGKSSLLAALFRLCELHSGEIFIDTVNIAHISLTALRSRLAVIPQDPFLFSGSVRENLDPLSEYQDAELWGALQRCHLAAAVRKIGGLGAQLGHGGHSFSVGQRQLLCLVRAVLHNAKILCIDEATANVDQETDRHIQRTLRSSFRQSTVFTIAHRVRTIMDSDRVLVMGDGEILEFDCPDILLQNKQSHFYNLASQEFQ